MRHFRDTLLVVVRGHLESVCTEVASAVVQIVDAVRDNVHADLVRILDLVVAADLSAAAGTGVGVHFAVGDCRTAQVVGDFDVAIGAVATLP